ncbi:MAG: threonine/serine exporter family protein [Lachnospiraceae bacterium]|nr:threonine/serine exporter family protein [Lachnospiraceae bacterium]
MNSNFINSSIERTQFEPTNPTEAPTAKNVLTLAVEMGDLLLRNGGEIYRVEDTILHVLEAYGMENYDVYVLSNGIFASANEDRNDSCSIVRHVPLGSVNLDKIAAINQLSREIAQNKIPVKEAWDRFLEIKEMKMHPQMLMNLCGGIGSAGFCYLFGGSVLDSLIAFFIGIPLAFFLAYMSSKKTSKFIMHILGSAYVTLLSLLVMYLSAPVHYDKIIIGCIMQMVPGIALSTSIRDLFNGDYLSGAIHLLDAVLTAMCIAVGVGFMIAIYYFATGVMP